MLVGQGACVYSSNPMAGGACQDCDMSVAVQEQVMQHAVQYMALQLNDSVEEVGLKGRSTWH